MKYRELMTDLCVYEQAEFRDLRTALVPLKAEEGKGVSSKFLVQLMITDSRDPFIRLMSFPAPPWEAEMEVFLLPKLSSRCIAGGYREHKGRGYQGNDGFD